MRPSPEAMTQMFLDGRRGHQEALSELMPLGYDELGRLAHRYLRRELPGHTLQTTELVHEAYLRLVDQTEVRWQDRAHFLGIAAASMRRILIEHARSRRAAKRGEGERPLVFDEAIRGPEGRDVGLMALDDALNSLAA